MVSAGDFRKGTKFLFREQPYIVVDFQWTKPGKGGAYIRTKMKNMITGSIHEETFRAEEKFDTPDLEYKDVQYLYADQDQYHFMDQESYDQLALQEKQIADIKDYLKEQATYNILYFEGNPIAITPPMFMELKVTETQPGVRGDTAQGGATKPATLETGLILQVPLFVNEEDIIKVDTRSAEYIERVKK